MQVSLLDAIFKWVMCPDDGDEEHRHLQPFSNTADLLKSSYLSNNSTTQEVQVAGGTNSNSENVPSCIWLGA